MRFPLLGVVSSLVTAITVGAASAHPLLVLPAHHVSLLAVKAASHVVQPSVHGAGIVSSQSLLTLLTKSKGGASLSGLAVSGSAKALLLQDKLIVQNGFNSGISSLAHATITNGGIKGQVYLLSGTTNYNPFGVNTFFLGNSPFNVGGASSVYPAGAPSVAASFVNIAGTQGAASSLIKILGKPGAPVSLASATSRAELARFKSLSEASFKLGAGVNGGVVTNGQISGTFYDGLAGNVFNKTGKLVITFGNNPLNLNPAAFSSSNPASYLDFGKYQYNISSGSIFPTVYFGTQREGLFIAIGSNPFNAANSPASVIETKFLSTLIGKLAFEKHAF